MRVETEQGIVGWGEGTLVGHTEAIEGAYKDLAERFIGWDSDQIQNIWQHAYRSRFYRGGPVLMVSSDLSPATYSNRDSNSSRYHHISCLDL